MYKGRLYRCLFVLLLALLSRGIAPAQSTTSIRGVVTDPRGSVLPGASVVLTDTDSKTQRAAKTGEQGEYQFLFLTPGTYSLTVTATGFGTYQENGLQLLINTPATRNVQVTVASANENVTVTSEAPALNMVDASLGNTFDETQVKEIPLEGRNVPDLLSLQPGVAYTGDRTDIDNAGHTQRRCQWCAQRSKQCLARRRRCQRSGKRFRIYLGAACHTGFHSGVSCNHE